MMKTQAKIMSMANSKANNFERIQAKAAAKLAKMYEPHSKSLQKTRMQAKALANIDAVLANQKQAEEQFR